MEIQCVLQFYNYVSKCHLLTKMWAGGVLAKALNEEAISTWQADIFDKYKMTQYTPYGFILKYDRIKILFVDTTPFQDNQRPDHIMDKTSSI